MHARAAFASSFVVVTWAWAAGCSYDWTVGASPSITDAEAETISHPDVDIPDASMKEASGDADSSMVGPSDTGIPPVDAPDSNCPQLAIALQQQRSASVACMAAQIGQPCIQAHHDECNCQVWASSASAATNYDIALQSFSSAGCSGPGLGLCMATCPPNVAVSYCLETDMPDGGVMPACAQ
jgi:hypothetical protein